MLYRESRNLCIDEIKPGLENTSRSLAFRGEDAVCGKRCTNRNLLILQSRNGHF